MEGEAISVLCADYGIYEGNMIRSVLKLQSMLEEWRSLITYCGNLDILNSLRDSHNLLIRDSVIQDSLYLHL